MKRIQIVPQRGFNLYGAMIQKEVEQSKRKSGTFFRSGPKERNRAKWAHIKHKGWIKLQRGSGGMVNAEVRTRAKGGSDWELFHAFIGFLDRQFGNELLSINIQYVA